MDDPAGETASGSQIDSGALAAKAGPTTPLDTAAKEPVAKPVGEPAPNPEAITATDTAPGSASKPDPGLAPARSLEEAAARLFNLFSFDQVHELAALAGHKTIRYRLRRDKKVGRWISINTAKDNALSAIFDSSNEAGEGYAVAAIAIDTQEERFKVERKSATISYDAESGYYGAVFQFSVVPGQVRLTSIEAWEISPL